MALIPIIQDRIKELTTTSGTGSITLNGAEFNFLSFASSIPLSTSFPYAIIGVVNAEWEIGYGQLTSPTTLQRIYVYSSTNSGSLVNFSTAEKEVFVGLPSELAVMYDLDIQNGYNVFLSGSVTSSLGYQVNSGPIQGYFGSGSNGTLFIGTTTAQSLEVLVSGSVTWVFDSFTANALRPGTDNVADIGLTNRRVRNIYAASTASIAHISGAFEGNAQLTSSLGMVTPYVSGTLSPMTWFFDRTDITVGNITLGQGNIWDLHFGLNPNRSGSNVYSSVYYGNIYVNGINTGSITQYQMSYNQIFKAESNVSNLPGPFSASIQPFFTDGTNLYSMISANSSSMWLRIQVTTNMPSGSIQAPQPTTLRLTQRL